MPNFTLTPVDDNRSPAGPVGPFPGQLRQGNIDLRQRPVVHNPDGSISTVRSMSFENNKGQEVLVPTVSPDGKILSNREAMELYGKTRQQLGIFDNPEDADRYAIALHEAQARYYAGDEKPKGFRLTPVDEPSVTEDVLKSGASGVARGTADLLGLPGTISDAIDTGGEWIMRQIGLPTRGEAMTELGLDPGNPFSGEKMRGYASGASGGATDYQPQTTAGEYARTLGEFAPAAVTGPGSLIQKGAMATVPALLSESAGQVTEGTSLEPWARAGGAIVGGLGTGMLTRPRTVSGQSPRDILNEGGDLYEQAKPLMQGTAINNKTFRNVASKMGATARDFGLVPGEHDAIARIVNDTLRKAQKGTPTLAELETTRKQLLNAGQNTSNRSVAELSRRLVSQIDDSIETLGPGDIIGNAQDAQKGIAATQKARELWRTGRKSEIIQDAIAKAANTASGTENGLRIEFRRLLNNKKLARNFSPAEKEAIKKVATGTFAGNMARLVGTMGIPLDNGRNYLGALTGGMAGTAAGGPLGGLAATAAGTGARALSGKLTRDAANIVDQMVKAGPEAQKVFQQLTAQASQANRTAILRAYQQALQGFNIASPAPQRRP